MTPRAGRGLALRLTLLNAAVVGLAMLAIVAVMVLMSARAMRTHLAESVAAEIDVLVADYKIDGLDGVVGFIDQRADFSTPNHSRIYRLEDAQGRHLAGTWPGWPEGLDTDGRLLKRPNAGRSPATEWWIAAAALPDGSRVLVGFDSIEVDSVMDDIHRAAALLMAFALLLSLGLGALIHRTALAPIATIRRSAAQIIDGDLTHRIPLHGSGDEFDALAGTLNRMLDRISQLFDGMRSSTEAIAHDLRSPLARHRARLEQRLLESSASGDDAEWLHAALAEVDQVLGSFQSLLQLATVEAGAARSGFDEVDLAKILADAISLYEAEATAHDMTIHCSSPESCPVRGDRHLLFQAVTNLLDNALKYGPDGQTVRIQLSCGAGQATLNVRNEGHGFDDPERAFERLVRGDRARRTPGHGMGLTLVRAIARLHGGEVRARNLDHGAELRVTMPILQAAASRA
jgi:signal transduction histidine kinase